jgi:hypothetical protein
VTLAEFTNALMARGFPLSEIDGWNTGDLIDWAMEHDRQLRKARGEHVPDAYEQYRKLKAMEKSIEEMHAAGTIREEKYRSYRETLERCEARLKG